MRKATILVATIVLAALSAADTRAQSGYDLFQQGLVKERAEGNLDEAIKLYQRIVREYASDRTLAAKALIELGQCYEKLGNTEARKAYERVLRDYADQNDAASQARTRLAALAGANGSKTSEMVTRRVGAGPGVDILTSPSPDGRYLSYTDWDTGDLAIHELATGQKHRLTNKGSWYESVEFAEFPRISPDGKQVAYSWFNRDMSYDLRTIGTDGSGVRVLYHNEDLDYVQPADWSSDGKYVLALFTRKERTNQIVLVSVADGSLRVLKTLGWRYPQKMSLSPDGRYIAYDLPAKEDPLNRDIFLLSTDGSRETPLVEHPADDLFPVWAPDGKTILFASDRTGSRSLWALQVVDGKPEGSPQLVKQDTGQVVPMGFTRKGAFYYGIQIGYMDVYTAALNLVTGKLEAAPTPATHRFVGSNSSPDWSPDGQSLAYNSRRGLDLIGLGSTVISIRSVATGEERELSPRLNYVNYLRWSPDGRWFLVSGTDRKNRQGLFKIDVQTGDVIPIVQSGPGEYVFVPLWSPTGKTIFYMRSNAKNTCVVERDLPSDQEKELHCSAPPSLANEFMAFSPDGRQLAFTMADEATRSIALKVMPSPGGEPRELLRLKEPEGIQWNSIAWTPDGRQLLFGKRHGLPQQDFKAQLWGVSADGGEPHRLELAMDALRDLRFHPDGKRIAFTAGLNSAEVWVMENFLPELRASR